MGMTTGYGIELAFAIAHEVGNHFGGIRLRAHLLDEDLDARELAEASILIDGLAILSGPLLALLRPLLYDDWRPAGDSPWPQILSRIQKQVEDEGAGGTRFEIELGVSHAEGAELEAFTMLEHDWLHSLIVTLTEATIAQSGRGGAVVLRLESGASERTLWVEDDGAAEDVAAGAAARG